MSGETPHARLLESRKQLLIAESELNRAHLAEEWQTMTHRVRILAGRVKTVGAWTSSAALLMAGVTALRGGPVAAGAAKSSWFLKLLKGARMVATIWFAFRARGETAERR